MNYFTVKETIVLLHSVKATVAPVETIGKELLRGYRLLNVTDELLLEELFSTSPSYQKLRDRIYDHVTFAMEQNVKGLLCVCSSLSPMVEDVAAQVDFPVVTIDRRAIEEAVAKWGSIILVATSPTTISVTRGRIQTIASRKFGKEVKIQLVHCPDALWHYYNGDLVSHDRLVLGSLSQLDRTRFDGVLLAQASLARLASRIREAGLEVIDCLSCAFKELQEMITRASC